MSRSFADVHCNLAEEPDRALFGVAKILLLNGPNMNLLGEREPEIYGSTTLAELEASLTQQAAELGHELDCLQSNAEHELIDRVHAARKDGTAVIIINPAAFTHTSVALRDALAAVALPFYVVHISDIYSREPFRKNSYFADLAVEVYNGQGIKGYDSALQDAVAALQ